MGTRERALLEQVLQEIKDLREQLERPTVNAVSYGTTQSLSGNYTWTWTAPRDESGDESGDAGVREPRRDPPPQGPTDVALPNTFLETRRRDRPRRGGP